MVMDRSQFTDVAYSAVLQYPFRGPLRKWIRIGSVDTLSVTLHYRLDEQLIMGTFMYRV